MGCLINPDARETPQAPAGQPQIEQPAQPNNFGDDTNRKRVKTEDESDVPASKPQQPPQPAVPKRKPKKDVTPKSYIDFIPFYNKQDVSVDGTSLNYSKFKENKESIKFIGDHSKFMKHYFPSQLKGDVPLSILKQYVTDTKIVKKISKMILWNFYYFGITYNYKDDEAKMEITSKGKDRIKEWSKIESDYQILTYLLNICLEYGLKKYYNSFMIFLRKHISDGNCQEDFTFLTQYYPSWIELVVYNGYRRMKMPPPPPPPSSDPTYLGFKIPKVPPPPPPAIQNDNAPPDNSDRPEDKETDKDKENKQFRRPPPPPPPSQPGSMKTYNTIEERYTIIKELGQGSYAKVYLVDGGEMKVLKQYDLQALTPESKKMISDEIKIIQDLKHPNIIKYEECFFLPGFLCLILDYCDNGDLEQLISKKKEKRQLIQEDELLPLFRSLLCGVEYIHSKGVIHRDLKPANIFLNHINECIVGDFGISSNVTKTSNNNKDQGPMGTPRYMAPEILTSKEYTPKVDVWSLGCILHELCEYRPAFDGKSYQELIDNIKKRQPNRISSLFNPIIQQLIDEMLDKNPKKRPDVSAVLKKIDKLLSGSTEEEPPTTQENKQDIEKEKLYPTIKKIGQGAWGTVYLCKDLTVPNAGNVVLKKLNLKDMDPKSRGMVDNEVKILQELDCPYIVKYLDGFVTKSNYLCLIMQYCPNGDLEGVIKKQFNQRSYLHELYVLRFWVPIVHAIAYVHDRKIIHRDLKPANIFLGDQYNSMLGDFGIAKVSTGSDMAQTVIGSPMYMAPEVFTGSYDNKADIWGLGCILYELSSLNPPYKATSIIQLNQMIMTQPTPKLPGTYYSKDLQFLIDKLLCKNPIGRFSAKDILELPFIQNLK